MSNKGLAGLKVIRGVIRNPRAIAWMSDILAKSSWNYNSPLTPPQSGMVGGSPPLVAEELGGDGRLLTTGRVADLSTINSEVLAQLLSSALYHMAEESELTHIVRLRPTESIGPSLLPSCNALLLLGAKSTLLHHHLADGLKEPPVPLDIGDVVTRRGACARDWSMNIPPQSNRPPHTVRDKSRGGGGISASNPHISASNPHILQERILFLFKSEGEWPVLPGDPLWEAQQKLAESLGA